MIYPNPSTALASVIIDELIRSGVGSIVASPGSRSTALLLAADARPEIEVVMVIDERSAGFHALGRAKATGEVGVVLTTSGTAVANLMPAVVEADASRTPLVVLSGDRPPEMRGVGANQTIDQLGIFGRFVRSSVELGPGEREPQAPKWWRSMVASCVAAARGFGAVPGPVQINVAFREPTVSASDDGRTSTDPYPSDHEGRSELNPWTGMLRSRLPSPDLLADIATLIGASRRGLIIAGGGAGGSADIGVLAERLGWPLLATAESGLRTLEGAVSTGHHLVAAEGVHPDLILRFGTPGPSRRVLELISGAVPQVVVGSEWSDPGRVGRLMIDCDPGATAAGMADRVEARQSDGWLEWWQESDQRIREALGPELKGGITEPAVAAVVGGLDADLLAVASSMPIRDIEMFAWAPPPLVGNRGASGIDGFVSTALGAARSATRPLALSGDLSFLHDSNGFMCQPRPNCVFVIVDNGGGGIFSFLPQATHVGEEFDRLFATPPDRDLGLLADFHGVSHTSVTDTDGLQEAIRLGWKAGGVHMIVATTDRIDNVEEHRRLDGLAQDLLRSTPVPD